MHCCSMRILADWMMRSSCWAVRRSCVPDCSDMSTALLELPVICCRPWTALGLQRAHGHRRTILTNCKLGRLGSRRFNEVAPIVGTDFPRRQVEPLPGPFGYHWVERP